MALKPGERVLHLNCGEAWATRMAAQAVSGATGMAAGLDISQDRISQARADAREMDNVLFAVGAAEDIPFRDEFFDGVFSLESFSGFGNQEAMLRETRRVLVSGGRLCFLAGRGDESLHRQLLQAGGFVEIASAELSGSEGGALLWMASKP
jgi:ubiquinone/menaquinone biosynthesis C-methylase UbiE